MTSRYAKLEQRLAELEARAPLRGPYRIPLVVLEPGETEDDAAVRVGADLSHPMPMIILVGVTSL